MPTIRVAKRSRHGDDLLALFQSDVGSKVLSYASAQDLCTLDLLSKQFQALTNEPWKKLTKDRFGMNDGKDGWRLGTSFLREPVVMKLTDEVEEEEGYGLYDGTPTVAANESIVVATSDMMNNEVVIRDASTLNYIRTDDYYSDIGNWIVVICGPVGSEIIVTSNKRRVYAQQQQGNTTQRWEYRNDTHRVAPNGIQLIGSESHLIVAFDRSIKVYEVNSVGEEHLLALRNTVVVEEGESNLDGDIEESIQWGPDKSCFVVGYPHQVCVWDLNVATNEISLTRTVLVDDWEVRNVALSNDYLIVATKFKQIHVWDRTTGVKVHDALCDDTLCDIGIIHEDDFIHPLHMSIHDHILVTTSHVGCDICVWNMKTGQLLKRHRHQREEEEPTAMVYLKHMNGFLCTVGCMKIWSFPTNQIQSERAVSIRSREVAKSLRANANDDA